MAYMHMAYAIVSLILKVYPRKLRSCDLVGAISRCGQSIRKADLERYTEFTNSFGQVG